ncbi:MAG: hypothetical protein AVDCRST_MAG69-16 [uncultured Solirubrobacteraceae bacterium]|uniref:PASTA domain-containing protein n=1 Tax=uncultured Solirubrobacteraceae bacterium TaxID=1162706 RepID=A0A6J4RC77_9ACTN|nr:MAG: hypothetical protein AVDCRST_MAG69-16 [uncultured Solirubrobacteraceae bacterium]
MVAEAPPEVDVPDVVDLREEEARSQLEQADLEVRRERIDAERPEDVGVVLEQDPPAGETLPPGSTVTIVVGRTPRTPDPEAPAGPGADPDDPGDPTDPTDPTR